MATTPNDDGAVALAKRVIAGLRTHFGRSARDFAILDVHQDHVLMAFRVEFELYDFYPMTFNYDRGGYGFSIVFGERGAGVLGADDVPGGIENMLAIAAELDRRIRLRIPDKYLEQYEPPAPL